MKSVWELVWKSARTPRRELLALLAPLALLTLAAARAPQARTSRPPLSFVTVHARDGHQSLATANPPLVQAVRYLLRNAFEVAKPGVSKAETVRNALAPVYGSDLTETSLEMGYYVLWDGIRWVIICHGASQFEIDLGDQGAVIIDTVDSTAVS